MPDKEVKTVQDQIYIHKTTGTRNKYMSRVFHQYAKIIGYSWGIGEKTLEKMRPYLCVP